MKFLRYLASEAVNPTVYRLALLAGVAGLIYSLYKLAS